MIRQGFELETANLIPSCFACHFSRIIKQMKMGKDYYKTLGIAKGATDEEIKKVNLKRHLFRETHQLTVKMMFIPVGLSENGTEVSSGQEQGNQC